MSSGQEVGQIFGEGSGPATALLRSPTVIIASIGLWGMNVYFFRLFGIDYHYVLNLDLVKEKEREAAKGASSSSSSAPNSGNGNISPVPTSTIELTAISPVGSSATTTDPSVITEGHSDKWSDDGELDLTRRHQKRRDASSVASSGSKSSSGEAGEVTASKLLYLSFSLLLLLHTTTILWIDILNGTTLGAIFAFYSAVTVAIVVPCEQNLWIRKAAVTVLQRAAELLNPRCSCVAHGPEGPRPIPFIDVFFADAMCSLSKVFFDWGMLWHLASHYPEPVPSSTHSIIIPSLCASLPYIIRARQCLIMHTVGKIKNDPKRYQHLLNALKYSTSLFPLCVSAYQKTISEESAANLEYLLVTLLTINSLYSFAWDVVMDWGMMQNPTAVLEHAGCVPVPSSQAKGKSCGHAVLRNRLRFGLLSSVSILAADLILRFSWLLRYHEGVLFPNADAYVLCTQFLEAFRRAIWNLLRVEWENIKQMKSKSGSKKSPARSNLKSDDEEEQRPLFIGSNSTSISAPRSNAM
mmetsp:Transcript_8950/g.13051  ORF Transcript_8950/g.13051 Transcript_8950/m.13051 type:complete len:523 (+) Transcript_8950:102-1670(+)